MLQSNLADILLGIIGVFLSLSLLASAINEWIMRKIYSRGTNLKIAIEGMLSDYDQSSDLAQAFFSHPFFTKLHESPLNPPSYLNNHDFSRILTDVLAGYKTGNPHTLDSLHKGVAQLPSSPSRELLMSFLSNSNDIATFDEQLQNWFDSTMQRASGWYKRKSHISLLQIGFIMAAVLNVDCFALFSHLQKDTQSLEALAQFAESYQNLADSTQSQLSQAIQVVNNPSFYGLGWKPPQELYLPSQFIWILSQIPKHLFGWILSAIAISLGAPFWFDALNKVIKMRNSGKEPTAKTLKSSGAKS